MKGTIIVEGTFNEGYEKYFEEYSLKIQALLKQHNAITIRRQLIIETLYGTDKPNLIMVIDFENSEVAKTIFFEKEYLSIIPLRDKVFKTFKMYLASHGNV